MKHSNSRAIDSSRASGDYIDIGSAMRVLWQNKLLVSLVAATVFALGCAYAVLVPPLFRANILIKVDVGDTLPKNIPASLSGIFELKSAAGAELEMMRSRSVVTGAVENARLYIEAKPRQIPLVGAFLSRRSKTLSEPGLFGYAGYVWGAESIDVARFDVPDTLEKKAFVLRVDGPDTYDLRRGDDEYGRGTIGRDETMRTPDGDIRINVSALKGRQGAEYVLRRFSKADAVETLQKALVIAEQTKSSGLISASLEDTNPVQAAAILNEIARQYIQENVNLKTEEAERSLAFLETQLPDLKIAIEGAEAKYNAFRNARGTVDLGEEVKAVLQQSVQSQMRLVELRQRRDELLTRYQDENPLVTAVNRQIQTVSAELGSINEKIRKIPATEQDAARLTRDVKVNTELYASLLNTAQQLKLVKASRIGSARLIDSAVQPSTPFKPNRKLIAAGSAAAGLLLGIFMAFVRRSMANTIDTQDDLALAIRMPIGAVVPHSAHQSRLLGRTLSKHKGINLLANDATEEGAIESLRTFRTTLQFSLLSARNNVITIVGPTSGVGKSFVAANLSALLASSGKRVLLVDADLRGGYLHRYFGLERRAGLSELIAGESSLGEATNVNIVGNLDFISTGSIRARPADALANGKLSQILGQLSGRYDYVVIDTAPVLAIADSLIVSKDAGLIFCVARRGVTTVQQIFETQRRFEQSGNPITSLIFNDAKPSDVSYGSGYRRIPLSTELSALRRQ